MILAYTSYTAYLREPEPSETITMDLNNIRRSTVGNVTLANRPTTWSDRTTHTFVSSGNTFAAMQGLRNLLLAAHGNRISLTALGITHNVIVLDQACVTTTQRDNCSYTVTLTVRVV